MIELSDKHSKLSVNVEWRHNDDLHKMSQLQSKLQSLYKKVDESSRKISQAKALLLKANQIAESKLQKFEVKAG